VIASYLDAPFTVLGTDGFGRSDTRAALRAFFEVDRHHVVLAALTALRDQGAIPASTCVTPSRATDCLRMPCHRGSLELGP
jgi:pyruvate dehydrogenase E1 component